MEIKLFRKGDITVIAAIIVAALVFAYMSISGGENLQAVITVDGKVVETIDDINELRDAHKVGDFMDIVVSRNGKNVSLKVKLMEERPEQ